MLKDFEQDTNIARESYGVRSVCRGGEGGPSPLNLGFHFHLAEVIETDKSLSRSINTS